MVHLISYSFVTQYFIFPIRIFSFGSRDLTRAEPWLREYRVTARSTQQKVSLFRSHKLDCRRLRATSLELTYDDTRAKTNILGRVYQEAFRFGGPPVQKSAKKREIGIVSGGHFVACVVDVRKHKCLMIGSHARGILVHCLCIIQYLHCFLYFFFTATFCGLQLTHENLLCILPGWIVATKYFH